MPSPPSRLPISGIVAALLSLLLTASLFFVHPLTQDRPEPSQLRILTAVYCLAGASLLAAYLLLRRGFTPTTSRLALIFSLGMLVRLLSFTQPPQYETDFHRFLWDGAVTAHGLSPYTTPPAAAHSSASLAPLAATAHPTLLHINHPELTTIYPPIAQAFFALAYFISPFDTVALRAVFLLADLAILGLLLHLLPTLGRPQLAVILYWWNPVVIKEFYLAAHMDAIAIVFALAAFALVLANRRKAGMIVLALAVGVKLWPLLLAPLLIRYRSPSIRSTVLHALLFSSVAAFASFPLLTSWDVPTTSGLSAYALWWTNNAGLFSLVDYALLKLAENGVPMLTDPVRVGRYLSAMLTAAWLAFLLLPSLSTPRAMARWAAIALSIFFLLSPTQFPWYYTWALPFLVLSPLPALFLYTALIPLYHLQYLHPAVLWVQHVPVWLILLPSLRAGKDLTPAGTDATPSSESTSTAGGVTQSSRR